MQIEDIKREMKKYCIKKNNLFIYSTNYISASLF